MASYLIDKLEELKKDENKLKEQQRVLMEEIELDIEKKRRLELDGTIIKLRAQVGELTKNIEGEIMHDNIMLVLRFGKHNYTQEELMQLQSNELRGVLRMTTLEKFKNNLSKMDEWMNNGTPMHQRLQLLNQNIRHPNPLEIPKEIKIYDDIIPIFSTMIGIMKKQEFEIDNLKKKIEKLL